MTEFLLPFDVEGIHVINFVVENPKAVLFGMIWEKQCDCCSLLDCPT